MQTAEQLAAFAVAAGCDVRQRHDLYDGTAALELECYHHRRKVDLLERLAAADAETPTVRRLAEDIAAGTWGDAERAASIQAWVQAHVDFSREKVETFNPPARTLAIGLGDCDDHARLVMALLGALDIPARLETLPTRASGETPTHVAAQWWDGDNWVWLETTVRARYGEHPQTAAHRLGLATRADLGEIADTPLSRSVDWVYWAGGAASLGALWWLARR